MKTQLETELTILARTHAGTLSAMARLAGVDQLTVWRAVATDYYKRPPYRILALFADALGAPREDVIETWKRDRAVAKQGGA